MIDVIGNPRLKGYIRDFPYHAPTIDKYLVDPAGLTDVSMSRDNIFVRKYKPQLIIRVLFEVLFQCRGFHKSNTLSIRGEITAPWTADQRANRRGNGGADRRERGRAHALRHVQSRGQNDADRRHPRGEQGET